MNIQKLSAVRAHEASLENSLHSLEYMRVSSLEYREPLTALLLEEMKRFFDLKTATLRKHRRNQRAYRTRRNRRRLVRC